MQPLHQRGDASLQHRGDAALHQRDGGLLSVEIRATGSGFLFEVSSGTLRSCWDRIDWWRTQRIRDWYATIRASDGHVVISVGS